MFFDEDDYLSRMRKIGLLLALLLGLKMGVYGQKENPLQSFSCKHIAHSRQASTANGQAYPFRLLAQKLAIRLDPNRRYIAGSVEYRLVFTDIAQQILLDFGSGIRDSALLANDSLVFVLNQNWALPASFTDEKLVLQLPPSQQIGDTLEFRVYFRGEPNDDGNSFGSFRTAAHGPDQKPVLWTLSQPYGARNWWPNFQTLGIKADTTELIVRTPPGYLAGGPGLLTSIDSSGSEWVHHWEHHYPCPPYLIGTAVADYWVYKQQIPINGDTIQVVNYLYAEDSVIWKERLNDFLPPVFQLFTDLFGPYPFLKEKYGHMQISNSDGGMEHNTMSSMGSYGHMLIAHELAHQWYGNKITCSSWQDIWFNEGFASWMTGLTLERILDNGYWWEPWKLTQKESATRSQDYVVFKQDTSLVSALFENRSTYHKASLVLHQLRYLLGDSALFAGTRRLMTDSSLGYGFANTETVRLYLEEACQCSLSAYFDRWVYSSGHPEYRIRWNDLSDGLQLYIEDQSPGRPFALPLPFRAYSSEGDSLDFRAEMDQKTLNMRIKLPFRPVHIRFDPESWLLAKEISLEKTPDRLLVLYPPNEAAIDVLLPESWEGQIARLQLYDLLGRLVYELPNPGELAQYRLPLIPLGQTNQGVVVGIHPDGRKAFARIAGLGW